MPATQVPAVGDTVTVRTLIGLEVGTVLGRTTPGVGAQRVTVQFADRTQSSWALADLVPAPSSPLYGNLPTDVATTPPTIAERIAARRNP